MTDEYDETNAPPADSSPAPELTADEQALLDARRVVVLRRHRAYLS